MKTTNISPNKFLTALLAPFGGAETHDKNGNLIESSSQKSWTYTLYNANKETHLTYRSRRPKGWTCKGPVLIDVQINQEFMFLGSVNNQGMFKPSDKSKIDEHNRSHTANALQWVLSRIVEQRTLPTALEIKGSTCCARCGRALTNPDSIDDGLGPICRAKQNNSVVSKA